MKKIIYSLGLVMILSLAGCVHKPVQPTLHKLTLAERRALYMDQLRADNIQVIHLGETLRFVILSDDLFQPDSANVRYQERHALKVMAKLMRTYDKDDIQVAAYTDNQGNIARQQALTTRQAQVVASFLWAQGIDARLTYAQGYNRKNAVDWNGSVAGRHNNRRVEVSFQYYPEYVPYG